MRSLRVLATTTILAAACGPADLAGPGSVVKTALRFCGQSPGWFAIRNEGREWETVKAVAPGLFEFDATPRVSVAYVYSGSGSFSTQVFNVTAEEIGDGTIQTCGAGSGTKALAAAVSDLDGDQVARIYIGDHAEFVSRQEPSVVFFQLPDKPLDLVATRSPAFFGAPPPDRVIVRRDVYLPDGSTIPDLDFGAESAPILTGTVSLEGIAGDLLQLRTNFITHNGTSFPVASTSGTAAVANVIPFYSVPGELTTESDLQALSAFTSSAQGSRRITHFFRLPGDLALAFGPHVNAPTFTRLAVTPYLRLSAAVPLQPEYATAMEVAVGQRLPGGAANELDIITTAAFLNGTPGTWELLIPDFGSEYNAAWGLSAAQPFDWLVQGFGGGENSIIIGAATDGTTILSSARSSSMNDTRSVVALERRRDSTPSWCPTSARMRYSAFRCTTLR